MVLNTVKSLYNGSPELSHPGKTANLSPLNFPQVPISSLPAAASPQLVSTSLTPLNTSCKSKVVTFQLKPSPWPQTGFLIMWCDAGRLTGPSRKAQKQLKVRNQVWRSAGPISPCSEVPRPLATWGGLRVTSDGPDSSSYFCPGLKCVAWENFLSLTSLRATCQQKDNVHREKAAKVTHIPAPE